MKKIIAYSLWGNDDKYLVGALENIETQQEFYPDWICRFYCHVDVKPKWIQALKDKHVEVIIKDENPSNGPGDAPGMFWRFEVLKDKDKDIERFIVRDCDSRLSQREVECVKEWIESRKEFHIIRDHVQHNTLIMGGMWGATKEFIDRINYDGLVKQFFAMPYANVCGSDQAFLSSMIYPLIKDNVIIHDDWDRYREGARRVPHFKTDYFIGESINKLYGIR